MIHELETGIPREAHMQSWAPWFAMMAYERRVVAKFCDLLIIEQARGRRDWTKQSSYMGGK